MAFSSEMGKVSNIKKPETIVETMVAENDKVCFGSLQTMLVNKEGSMLIPITMSMNLIILYEFFLLSTDIASS